VLDEHGDSMHKSKGNSIAFDDAAAIVGSDSMRWLYTSHAPEQDLRFPRIPSEADLVAHYGVSRMTVRRAIESLADDGLVNSRRGSGTFVTDRRDLLRYDVDLLRPWREQLLATGHVARSRLMETSANAHVPEDLRRNANIPALFEPGVPGQAHAGEIGDLFSSQTWGPAPLTGLETDGNWVNPRPAALQEIAELGAGGGVNTRITRLLVPGSGARQACSMTNTLTTAGPARAAQRRAPSTGGILAVVLTGQFMALLDASVVNVAAPAIHASLHASGAGLQLVIAGYVITYAVLLVTGARLGDIIGHRTMFLFGVALFTLASLGCGLAGSTSVLVTLRFVQGAGAAAMIPQVLSLIQHGAMFNGVNPGAHRSFDSLGALGVGHYFLASAMRNLHRLGHLFLA